VNFSHIRKFEILGCDNALANDQVALDAEMTELHRCKAMLGIEWAVAIGYSKAWARASAVAVAVNHEGMPHPTIPGAIQNVAVATTLLDTLPMPSADGVSKVYQQKKNIIGVAAERQVESSLQQRAEFSITDLGRSKASR
jgi:hypothetical protein